MTLLDLDEGESAEIHTLRGETAETKRMQALGLHAGRKVRFVRAGPFSGPLLIEDPATGARLMIARNMAANVEVKSERPHKS